MHPLTRWLLDRLPQSAAFEETAVVAPSSGAASALRRAIVQAGRDLIGVHFVTAPGLARIACERLGVVCPARRPDPLEERALLEQCVDRHRGPLSAYARKFPSALREVAGAIREWQLGGCPTPADGSAREFLELATDWTRATSRFATRARLIQLAIESLERATTAPLPRVLLVVPRPSADLETLCAALLERGTELESYRAPEGTPDEVVRATAPDLESELRLAARACAASHASGTPWHESVVAVPQLTAYASSIRRAFEAEGVPFATDVESSLLQEPRAAACAHAAQLLFGDTPRRSYLALLNSPFLRDRPRSAELHLFDELSRQDHVHGRGEHMHEFARYYRGKARDIEERTIAPVLLERWLAASERVPEDATNAARVDALQDFLHRHFRTPDVDTRDATCSERVLDALDAVRRASAIRDPDAPGPVFAAEMERLLGERGMPMFGADPDGVRIVDYGDAMAHPATDLHVCGLAEGFVPSGGLSDVVLGDRDRDAMGLPNREAHRQAQRGTLRALCFQPTSRLSLTRPRRGADDRPIHESAWTRDLPLELPKERYEPTHPLSRARERVAAGRCPRDLALLRLAIDAAEPDAITTISGPRARSVLDAARRLEKFEPTSLTRDGDIGEAIGRRVAETSTSVSSMRTLGYCPQQFLFRFVFGLRPLAPEPDPCELPRDRLGTRIHTVLEKLFKEFTEPLGQATTCRELLDAMEARASVLLDQELERERGPLRRDFPTLHLLLVRRWRDALHHSLAQDLERMDQDGSRPLQLEESLKTTLKLTTLDQESIDLAVHGRADRIDRLENGALRLIDFKTGFTPDKDVDEKEILTGRRPSLPLYALMLQAEERPVAEAAIRAVRPQPDDAPPIDFEHVLERTGELAAGKFGAAFKESVAALADLRRRGLFVHGGDKAPCQWCEFRVACRRLHPPSASRVRGCGAREAHRFFRVQRKTKRYPNIVRGGDE